MAAPVAGDKFIATGAGYAARAQTAVEQEFPFLLNPARVVISTSVANSGNNDLYTVAAGKRAFVASSRILLTGGAVYFALKRSGVYYPLSIATSIGVSNGVVAAGFVFEAGDIIAFNHSTADAINYNLGIVTFDAPASGPRGLKTYTELAPINGNSTLCTVAASCVMQFPNMGVQGGVAIGGGSASVAFVYNGSGSARNYGGYIVPSGGSADATTQFYATAATNDSARGTMTPAGYMAASTAFIMSTNANTTQQTMWVTTLETSA